MFNRLIGSLHTLFNRSVSPASPTPPPIITEVELFPNPVDTGQTYLIKVKVVVIDTTHSGGGSSK